MELEQLEKLAREAAEEAEGDWFDPDLIESTHPILATRKARRLHAAASPDVILRLVAIARAAEAAYERHSCGEVNGVWAALRKALGELQ